LPLCNCYGWLGAKNQLPIYMEVRFAIFKVKVTQPTVFSELLILLQPNWYVVLYSCHSVWWKHWILIFLRGFLSSWSWLLNVVARNSNAIKVRTRSMKTKPNKIKCERHRCGMSTVTSAIYHSTSSEYYTKEKSVWISVYNIHKSDIWHNYHACTCSDLPWQHKH